MSISTTTPYVTAAGNGATTVFPYTFKVNTTADLVVTLVNDSTEVETAQVLTTNYTVSGAGNLGGGNVTMLVAPPSGYTLVIRQGCAITQITDIKNQNPYSPVSVENALDKLTMVAQELKFLVDKCIKIPETEVGTAAKVTVSGDVTRANKVLSFDASGNVRASTVAELYGSFTSTRIPFAGGAGSLVDSAALIWDSVNRGLFVGAAVTPAGGIGRAGIIIEGPDSSPVGPYYQAITDSDTKPVFTILPFSHDLTELWFDVYADANLVNYVSASVNSNVLVAKTAATFEIDYSTGIASGVNIGPLLTRGIVFYTTSTNAGFTQFMSDIAVGGAFTLTTNTHSLRLKNAGALSVINSQADNLEIQLGGSPVVNWSFSTGAATFSYPILEAAGTAAAPTFSFSAETTLGIFRKAAGYMGITWDGTNTNILIGQTLLALGSTGILTWASGVDAYNNAGDVILARDAAAVLAVKNGANAQTVRIYGNTTGSKYVSVSHDGTNAYITQNGANQIAFASAAKGTTDTTGYVCVPSCAGAPTGVPANIPTGQIPVVYDSTNNFLYVYSGAWKKSTVYA